MNELTAIAKKLGKKGGLKTKQRLEKDPDYYKRISKLAHKKRWGSDTKTVTQDIPRNQDKPTVSNTESKSEK